jgi:nickel-dependent lactate racemase
MPSAVPMAADAATLGQALDTPIGSPRLGEIIAGKDRPPEQLRVCISVSDITRPVPYRGPTGILGPLLRAVEAAGVRRENIVILIGNGMHRPSTPQERVFMYGQDVVDGYHIVDHDCEDQAALVLAARTQRGTDVYVNRRFHEADLRIVTGLVESHFMAGASGGRKGVCPALVNMRTLEYFHGVDFLEHPNAANLVLDGNPCHEESLEVAQAAGVDFLVNVTLDSTFRLTGVFAGDLVEAHRAALAALQPSVTIPITEPYDIVLSHGGYVGRNHYQLAKAAVGAMPAVKERGTLILAANNVDTEPIGSPEYKTFLHLLKMLGPDGYISILRHPDWRFTKDQWQPEMWGKPLRKVGMEGLIYCAPQIPPEDYAIIPGINGYDVLEPDARFASDIDKVQAMVEHAVQFAVARAMQQGRQPRMAYIEDGPYAVPVQR